MPPCLRRPGKQSVMIAAGVQCGFECQSIKLSKGTSTCGSIVANTADKETTCRTEVLERLTIGRKRRCERLASLVAHESPHDGRHPRSRQCLRGRGRRLRRGCDVAMSPHEWCCILRGERWGRCLETHCPEHLFRTAVPGSTLRDYRVSLTNRFEGFGSRLGVGKVEWGAVFRTVCGWIARVTEDRSDSWCPATREALSSKSSSTFLSPTTNPCHSPFHQCVYGVIILLVAELVALPPYEGDNVHSSHWLHLPSSLAS